MSERALQSILLARKNGEFTSLRDFSLRTNTSQAIVENLIKVGAFDAIADRGNLLLQLPELKKMKHAVCRGTKTFIKDEKLEPRIIREHAESDIKAKMLSERDLLALDLSAHPLDFFPLDNGFTRKKTYPQWLPVRLLRSSVL